MASDAASTYDELPYESNPFEWTHPDRLATVARLYGVKTPPVERSRVLELGCAGGGNLIPMALALPGGRFLGVDLSPRQVRDARQVSAALGLSNIELRAASILDVTADWGEFDYIISHGVYSWVPAEVRDKILEVCASQLAPDGVAYVSYNTYPGWGPRRLIRDAIAYHAHRFPDPRTQVRQARAFIDFLARYVNVPGGSVYPMLLKGGAEYFRQQSDSYLMHEYLEEVNEPVFFHQFLERAAARRLTYVGDAKLVAAPADPWPPEVEAALREFTSDPLEREQYLDLLRNQSFRRSLLCRPGVTPNRVILPEAVPELLVASPAQPATRDADLNSPVEVPFRGLRDTHMSTAVPLVKSALVHLGEAWPRCVPFAALREAACARLGGAPGGEAGDTGVLVAGLLEGFRAQLVQLHAWAPPCVRAGVRPMASPLARYQANSAQRVTNLRQEVVELMDVDRQLVRHLDGSRDRAALEDLLAGLVAEGVLRLPPATAPDQVRAVIRASLEPALARLATWSLLMG
jgi:SAM-dependent methyltransferase/methyltransferase-like protein